MIKRALHLGAWGALVGIVPYLMLHVVDVVWEIVILQKLLPAVALWYLFRRFFIRRPLIRLFGLFAAFLFSGITAVYIVVNAFSTVYRNDMRLFSVSIGIGTLLVWAIAIPFVLGTPSIYRSTVRIALVACMLLVIHLAFTALNELLNRTGYPPGVEFALVFGIESVRLGLLFAALAPDHIAMERIARARNLSTICEKCEYDLTGNVSGVCPECGTALSEALRQHLHRRGENAWGAEHAPAMEMGKE